MTEPKAGEICPDCGYFPLEDDGTVWCPGCDREWEPSVEPEAGDDEFPD